jgi:hypothetical protein
VGVIGGGAAGQWLYNRKKVRRGGCARAEVVKP